MSFSPATAIYYCLTALPALRTRNESVHLQLINDRAGGQVNSHSAAGGMIKLLTAKTMMYQDSGHGDNRLLLHKNCN